MVKKEKKWIGVHRGAFGSVARFVWCPLPQLVHQD